jgi:hypothetical protein
MRGLCWSLSLAVLVASCGDAGTSAGRQDVTVDEEPAPTVFDPMVGTMDRAAAVEELSLSRKGELDAAIDGSD